ncbi:hypothetical protein SAMN04490200_5112 [Pseudomonas proteolytica]|nr:hypothetical protein SAMN04490200_5112 [Pseudomonas proteolytica]
MPRAGWRSRPKTCWLGMSETTAVPGVGLLRSPARGKPARHYKRARRKKSTVQENCCAAAPQTPDLPPPSQWRAGLPRAGWRSRPKTCWFGMSETTAVPGVGLLRSPARGKPARHHKRAGRKKSTVQENCCAAAPQLPTCRRPPCGERACPALGGEAAPKPAGLVCLKQPQCLGWGCYAAQRGCKPARHYKRAGRKKSTVQENCCAAAPQTPDLPPPSLWRAGLPRVGWRSRPKTCWLGMSETTAVPGVGLLRSPARGKPARHSKPAGHYKRARHSDRLTPLTALRQRAGR